MVNDIFIGNTDHDWFEFCKSQTRLEAVNFWRPSKQPFKAIEIGGLFFFRRKSPIDKIGGFGEFIATGQISIKDAWDDLGIANGVEGLEEFVSRVAKYRKSKSVNHNDLITFNILKNVKFLEEDDWFPMPSDWSPNIVTGKSYDSSTSEGYRLLKKAQEFATFSTQSDKNIFGFSDTQPTGYTTKDNIKVRIGQGAFRLSIVAAYSGKCAVTGSNVLPTLDAAHINSFARSENNDITNGILLRRDIHKLYDEGLIGFTPDFRVEISEQLKELYPEASEYLLLDGQELNIPKDVRLRPIFT